MARERGAARRPGKFSTLDALSALRDATLEELEGVSVSLAKSTALSLVSRCNDDGLCWPGVKLLARESGVQKRQIQFTLRRLEQVGWIRTERRIGTSSVYRVLLGQPAQQHEEPAAAPAARELAHELPDVAALLERVARLEERLSRGQAAASSEASAPSPAAAVWFELEPRQPPTSGEKIHRSAIEAAKARRYDRRTEHVKRSSGNPAGRSGDSVTTTGLAHRSSDVTDITLTDRDELPLACLELLRGARDAWRAHRWKGLRGGEEVEPRVWELCDRVAELLIDDYATSYETAAWCVLGAWYGCEGYGDGFLERRKHELRWLPDHLPELETRAREMWRNHCAPDAARPNPLLHNMEARAADIGACASVVSGAIAAGRTVELDEASEAIATARAKRLGTRAA